MTGRTALLAWIAEGAAQRERRGTRPTAVGRHLVTGDPLPVNGYF